EGFIDGTFYDAWSYFASVDRKWNDRHVTNFVTFGAPYRRGGASASIQEMYDLSGSNYYNSFWGYQQGEKRSARIFDGYQPMFMLRHDWKANDRLQVSGVVGVQTGHNSVEAMDWLNAQDPRPDYYRRLPSYFRDPEVADEVRDVLLSDPANLQIQWDKLYDINYNSQSTIRNVNGIAGNDLT